MFISFGLAGGVGAAGLFSLAVVEPPPTAVVLPGIWGSDLPGEALVGDEFVLVGDTPGFLSREGRSGFGLPGMLFAGLDG